MPERTMAVHVSASSDLELNLYHLRALEEAVRRLSSGGSGSSGSFSGRGQTLGGGPSNAGGVGGDGVAILQGLDPQVKVLLCLLGGYALFWYLS